MAVLALAAFAPATVALAQDTTAAAKAPAGDTTGAAKPAATGPTAVGKASLENPLGMGVNSISDLFYKIVNFVISLSYVVIAFFLILSGFKFVMAQGSESELEKAKHTFYYTIIGAAVIVGAQTITAIVQKIIEGLGSK